MPEVMQLLDNFTNLKELVLFSTLEVDDADLCAECKPEHHQHQHDRHQPAAATPRRATTLQPTAQCAGSPVSAACEPVHCGPLCHHTQQRQLVHQSRHHTIHSQHQFKAAVPQHGKCPSFFGATSQSQVGRGSCSLCTHVLMQLGCFMTSYCISSGLEWPLYDQALHRQCGHSTETNFCRNKQFAQAILCPCLHSRPAQPSVVRPPLATCLPCDRSQILLLHLLHTTPFISNQHWMLCLLLNPLQPALGSCWMASLVYLPLTGPVQHTVAARVSRQQQPVQMSCHHLNLPGCLPA